MIQKDNDQTNKLKSNIKNIQIVQKKARKGTQSTKIKRKQINNKTVDIYPTLSMIS